MGLEIGVEEGELDDEAVVGLGAEDALRDGLGVFFAEEAELEAGD